MILLLKEVEEDLKRSQIKKLNQLLLIVPVIMKN